MVDIIKDLLSRENGKLIPQRINEKYLKKQGLFNFICNSFDDTYSIEEKIYCIIHNLSERKKCKFCNTPLKFKHGYSTFCSRKCSNNDPEILEKNKMGVSKTLKHLYSLYGDEIKEKRSNSLYKKYGVKVSSPFKIKEIQDSNKQILLNKYGVENMFYLSKFRSKGGDISRNKSIHLNHLRGYDIEYLEKGFVKIKSGCKIHGDIELDTTNFYNRYCRNRESIACPMCNPISSFSSLETQFENILKELKIIDFNKNNKSIISPYELDFYFPSHKIAIELNGVYWHSEIYKDSNYHKLKSDLCAKKGIQLIHIWEDDFYDKQDLLISMLKYKFNLCDHKIFARNCEIKDISSKTYRDFLYTNHIQGEINSSIRYGLFFKNELLAIMGFGKLRSSLGSKYLEKIYELQRFCVKQNNQIIGGASKLFEHFKRNVEFKKIITYAKRDYSLGNLYKKLGFKLINVCNPGFYWLIEGKRKHRYNYRKDQISNIDNKHLTSIEIMHNKGHIRCFDSGNFKFEYTN